MVSHNNYQDILFSTNFVGGAGKNDLSTISCETDDRADIEKDGNDTWQFYYYILTSLSDLDNLGYYDTPYNDIGGDMVYDREYDNLPSGSNPSLSANQTTILSAVLSGSAYSVTFSDVAKINFNSGTTSNADIVVGQTTNGNGVTSTTGGYEQDYSTGSSALKHGDVWFNEDFDLGDGNLWSDTSSGRYGYYTVLHELSHSLGLAHPPSGELNKMQFTIMSTDFLDGMNPSGTASDVLPSGLQLLDIAALQAIYGANYSTRAGNTTYKEGQGFGATVNDAFIYTIWDGGGTDTLDASGYADGVVIDLREGHFSSIGKAADSSYSGSRGTGLADENVAIAYNAEIENAIGTDQADTLIGNELDNTLNGGEGADEYIFDIDFGSDTVEDDWQDNSTLTFDSSVSVGDLIFSSSGDDFEIRQGDNIVTLKDLETTSNAVFPHISDDGGVTQLEVLSLSDSGTYTNYFGSARVILANGGNDTFYATPYVENFVFGGAGSDNLYGRYGSTVLHGEDGGDLLVASAVDGNIMKIYGGEGNDDLAFKANSSAVTASLYAEGGNDDDQYYIRPDNVSTSIEAYDISGDDDYFGLGGTGIITDIVGNDTYRADNYSRSLSIEDTFGDDLLILNDATYAQLSNVAQIDNDLVLSMPNGDITIKNYYLSSDYRIENVKFSDTGVFQLGLLTGGELLIIGTDSDDPSLSGTSANEKLLGLGGSDSLSGGEGADTLEGGAGNDTLIYADTGSAIDSLDGGADTDTADFSGFGYAVWVNLAYTFSAEAQTRDTTHVQSGTWREIATLDNIENVTGTVYDDELKGDGNANSLEGGSGSDSLWGAGGADFLYGEAGSDTLYGEAGGDELYGGDGYDYLYGNDGDDILAGGADDRDELYGGAGNDTLIFNNTGTHIEYMDGGADTDTADFSSFDHAIWVNLDYGGIEAWTRDGTDVQFGTWREIANLDNIENVIGSDYDDELKGDDNANSFTGGDGADKFFFLSASAFAAVDTITDFTTVQGDVLDISDLLSGYDPMTDLITDFVEITDSGSDSIVKVDISGSGTFGAGTQIATLLGVTGLYDEAALESAGSLVTA